MKPKSQACKNEMKPKSQAFMLVDINKMFSLFHRYLN